MRLLAEVLATRLVITHSEKNRGKGKMKDAINKTLSTKFANKIVHKSLILIQFYENRNC